MSNKGSKKENLMEGVWDDSELLKMYDESVKFNESNQSSEKKNTQWKVGDTCMAPFDELWYPAKILSIQEDQKTARVHFLDYEDEDDATVKISDLFKEEEVTYKEESVEENTDADMSESHAASASHVQPYNISIPKMVPPPPELFQTFTNEKEVTNNMMISWYMAGYNTGYFQAMRDLQKKAASQSRKQ